jgi:hypothetical protein
MFMTHSLQLKGLPRALFKLYLPTSLGCDLLSCAHHDLNCISPEGILKQESEQQGTYDGYIGEVMGELVMVVEALHGK